MPQQRFQIPNLSAIRTGKYDPEDLANALLSIQGAIGNINDQTNTNSIASSSGAPPVISGINVTEKGGIHDIQITDSSPAQRGINYFAEYSQTPDFQNVHKIDLGSSQNHRANLGAGTYYWRAYSSYGSSEHSQPVMHGGTSAAAVGSGTYSGPDMQQQQGGMGFGPLYRSSSTPPVRRG